MKVWNPRQLLPLAALLMLFSPLLPAQEQDPIPELTPEPALKPKLEQAPCGGSFADWRQGVAAEARAQGRSEQALARLAALSPDPKVLAHDRSQAVFTQDWLTFAGRMVNGYRLRLGREHLRDWASTFAEAQQRYGVPGPVITAFWGLETDYGQVLGDFDTLRALATLAHDCRRAAFFRQQLLAALELLDHGDLAANEFKGAWAGEIGQIQLLPSDYLRLGTDGNGDGRIDLRATKADVILTAARLLQDLGWRAGEPWLEEVQIPEQLPWAEVGLYNRLPRSRWVELGVRTASGSQLLADGYASPELPAALLLPMGRHGPAFLAYPNMDVFLEWNQSLVYATTAAYFATRLDGASKVNPRAPDPGLSGEQMKQLQQTLKDLGYDVGKIDGILGAKTRAAVRAEQLRRNIPADAWPTPALLQVL
ncbi:lytic murein transglycosylase [Thiorhodovibrio frisius]|uniref:Lytic murein transglycosylase n=1 Tax=Thiorhodovibrio frisius TaxID=631362 RepID=H8Z2Q2_9GAMM|nr:lytic murein transglycosylase [Thiorhodovibrio frisius]EIC22745.1 lytic murein transglycosylase [Thiorhodovibrio frisius]WPL22502.1 Membrane-bound lytic murein transglycosylase B precursor [Thiorhodovibrio frisius]